MKKILTIVCTVFLLVSCAPSVYQVYDKYNQDPNFEHTKVSGELLQLASFLIPKEQKEARSLLKAVNSVDVVHYIGKNNLEFQKAILNSLDKGGYKEMLKSNTMEKGATFFVKNRLGKVREFHVLNYEDGNVSVFSIDGQLSIGDLEKVYTLIKKQTRVKSLMENFDRRKRKDNKK